MDLLLHIPAHNLDRFTTKLMLEATSFVSNPTPEGRTFEVSAPTRVCNRLAELAQEFGGDVQLTAAEVLRAHIREIHKQYHQFGNPLKREGTRVVTKGLADAIEVAYRSL